MPGLMRMETMVRENTVLVAQRQDEYVNEHERITTMTFNPQFVAEPMRGMRLHYELLIVVEFAPALVWEDE